MHEKQTKATAGRRSGKVGQNDFAFLDVNHAARLTFFLALEEKEILRNGNCWVIIEKYSNGLLETS